MPKAKPDAIRAEAVELVKNGAGVREAARAVGVAAGSVSDWVHRSGVAVQNPTPTAAVAAVRAKWAERRAELVDAFGQIAERGAGRALDLLEDDPKAAKDAMLTAAIAFDKAQLGAGEATSRVEHASSPEDQRLRVAELLERLSARRDAPPLPG